MPNQSLFIEVKTILLQLIDTINILSYDEYNEKIPALSNASIGEHNRHIIELFQQLNLGYDAGQINYDDRKRDYRLQQNIDFATEALATIIKAIDKPDKRLILTSLYNNHESGIETTYLREVMYNLEHCIHHQAIIKVGMMQMNLHVTGKNFGIAKSTLEYKIQCVQ